jgi:transcriptional regulator with XRE-family HTH domain
MNHPNYLAFHRRRNGLNAQDLATLLGYRHRSTIRRCEIGERAPSLRFVLACQVVFGVAPAEMFPGLFSRIEDEVLTSGAILDRRVRGKSGEAASRQRRLLLRMVERANSRPLT